MSIYIAFVVGLLIGACVATAALCLFVARKLDADGWPTEFPEEPPRRQYQD